MVWTNSNSVYFAPMRIGGFHAISGDTNNSGEMNKCWWDKQSELMSDLWFTVHQHGGDNVKWKPPIIFSVFDNYAFCRKYRVQYPQWFCVESKVWSVMNCCISLRERCGRSSFSCGSFLLMRVIWAQCHAIKSKNRNSIIKVNKVNFFPS